MRPDRPRAAAAWAAMVLAAAAVVAIGVPAPARAAGADQAAPQATAARAAFTDGERYFQLGKFEQAIDAYERAFGLDPQPAFLFNIALAHRRQYEIDGKVEHLARARELYRNYLRLAPDSPRRTGVEKLLGELDAKIDDARRRQEPPPIAVAAGPPDATAAVAPPPSPVADLSPPRAQPPFPPPHVDVDSSTSSRPAPSRTGWYIAGGAVALAVGVALTVLLVSARSDPAPFDGPPVDLTLR